MSEVGGCFGFLSIAVPIAMIVVGSNLSISRVSNVMPICLFIKVGAQYKNDFDGCTAPG